MSGLFNGKQIKDGSITGAKLDVTYQRELTAGDNITIEGNIISSQIPVALSDEVLTYDTAGLKATLSVSVDGNQIQLLGKNDTNGDPIVIGEFNVLQSQIIDEVAIEDGYLNITFIVDGDPGKEKVSIDLSEFIDVYKGSEYINVIGDTISFKYDEVHDKLINDGFINDPTLYVTITDPQTITGLKTFDKVNIGSLFVANNLSTGSISTSGDILPVVSNHNSLGTAANNWFSVYTNYLYAQGSIWTHGKTSANDGKEGIALGGGALYISSADDPGIYFYRNNSTSATASIVQTGDNLLYTEDTIRTTKEFQSTHPNGFRLAYGDIGALLQNNGNYFYIRKTAFNDPFGDSDSTTPFFIDLSTSATNVVTLNIHDDTPSINFFKGDNTTANVSIKNTAVDILTINGSLVPSADLNSDLGTFALRWRSIKSSVGYFGSKTAIADGKTGTLIDSNGYMYLQGPNPGILLYRGSSTTTTASILNIANNVMQYIATFHNFKGNILPETTRIYNLGTEANRWATIFSTNEFVGSKTAYNDGNVGVILGGDGEVFLQHTTTPAVYFYRGTDTTPNVNIRNVSAGVLTIDAGTTRAGNFHPITTETYNLGEASARWNNLFVNTVYTGTKTNVTDGQTGAMLTRDGHLYLQGGTPGIRFYAEGATTFSDIYLHINNSIRVGTSLETLGNILPIHPNTYSFGSPTQSWSQGYFSDHIVVGNTKQNINDGISGCILHNNGNIYLTSNNNPAIFFYPTNSTSTDPAYIASSTNTSIYTNANFYPFLNNARLLGLTTNRWSTVYATNIDAHSVNGAAITSSGDGTKYLSDDGSYKTLKTDYDAAIEDLIQEISALKEELNAIKNP